MKKMKVRRGISAILAITTVFSLCSGMVAYGEHGIIPGDINGDDFCDVSDVVKTRAGIVGNVELTETEKTYADLNADTVVDISDIVIMRGIVIAAGYGGTVEAVNYKFLEVTPERLERAYRALIEYNVYKVEPTAEDKRIVCEDCIKYVLNNDNEIMKTWKWDTSRVWQNSAFYHGSVADNWAFSCGGDEYLYTQRKDVYDSSWKDFRKEAQHKADEFIELSSGKGWSQKAMCGISFNFSVDLEGDNISYYAYVVNFLYC